MLVVCMGIEALWQFQLHTQYVKKLGFIEISEYSHHASSTPRTENNIWIKKPVFLMFLIEFLGLGNS
jgi:hypothetical protein